MDKWCTVTVYIYIHRNHGRCTQTQTQTQHKHYHKDTKLCTRYLCSSQNHGKQWKVLNDNNFRVMTLSCLLFGIIIVAIVQTFASICCVVFDVYHSYKSHTLTHQPMLCLHVVRDIAMKM